MSIDVSRLQVSLEEGERWRRTLNITIPADLIREERQSAIRKLSSRIDLKGFRKGRVPASVVERQFGPAVDQELVDRVVGEAYRGVLHDQDLRPISEGEVEDVEYERDQDLTFKVSFDVAPEIELARVGGFQVERPRIQVGDEEVEKVLERLREQKGTWRPVEEGSPEDGDLVSVRIQRLAEEGDEPRPYEFTLGEGEAIPDVEEAIRTLEVGGEGDYTIAFPDDFPNEERRGDTDELRIFLDGRKVLERPELDDAFAASVGDFESLDDLRARVREDLEKEAAEEAEAAVRGALLDQIMAANPFAVPRSMIDQYLRGAVGQGDEGEFTEDQMAELREQLGGRAEHAVKRFLIIDELARSRELKATEDELDERIEAIAERNDVDPGEVYARLQTSGRLEQLEREITERKVFEFLKSESTITDAG
jgi:trigger factor